MIDENNSKQLHPYSDSYSETKTVFEDEDGGKRKTPSPVVIENPELEALAQAVQTVTGVKAGSWQLDGQIRTAAMELQQQGFSAAEVIETARQSGKAYKLKFIASDLATERAQLGVKRSGSNSKAPANTSLDKFKAAREI